MTSDIFEPLNVIGHIYKSGYFTNHGPLARQLELEIQNAFGTTNAVLAGNESLALVITLAGIGADSRLFIDEDLPGHIKVVARWFSTKRCPPPQQEQNESHPDTSEYKIRLLLLRDDTVCKVADMTSENTRPCDEMRIYLIDPAADIQKIARFLQLGNYPLSILCLTDDITHPSPACSVILVNDSALAETFRNIRSSYGVRKMVDVVATANGRVSEYQAGEGLHFIRRKQRGF